MELNLSRRPRAVRRSPNPVRRRTFVELTVISMARADQVLRAGKARPGV